MDWIYVAHGANVYLYYRYLTFEVALQLMLDPNHTKMHFKIFKGSQQKDFVRWKMQKLMPKSMQYATHEIIGPVKGYMTCEKNTESEN